MLNAELCFQTPSSPLMIYPNPHSHSLAGSCHHFFHLWRSTVHVHCQWACDQVLVTEQIKKRPSKTVPCDEGIQIHLYTPFAVYVHIFIAIIKYFQWRKNPGWNRIPCFSIQPSAWLTAALSCAEPKQHISKHLTTMISKPRQKNLTDDSISFLWQCGFCDPDGSLQPHVACLLNCTLPQHRLQTSLICECEVLVVQKITINFHQ